MTTEEITSDTSPDESCPVVGIGASAGGLEALERLFENTPIDSGLAFVVVQHLSPDFKSLTDDILARRTSIPICRVENGMAIRPNVIYLLPPRKDMIIAQRRLLLTDKAPSPTIALPIDHFFRSLAQDVGESAVGVILSGTGSDGSRGIREIRAHGGLVIAQEPESAKFDGMPRSALETGAVDLKLPPESIPAAIIRHARNPVLRTPVDAPLVQPAGLEQIIRLLRDAFAIDFMQYKPDTIGRRIERRIQLLSGVGIEEYAERLKIDRNELNLLYKDLLIGVTRFFRDESAFETLKNDVIPSLIDRLGSDDEFRVWIAGCATGEEAYSVAILINEVLENRHRRCNVKVFATDAHRGALEFAGVGVYSESALDGMSPQRQTKYFIKQGTGFQISPDIRKMVVFAQHNLLKDAPFTKLDLVCCRNVLIYFQPHAQKKVISLFHFGLKTGGVLFLGPSESAGELADEFEVVSNHWKIYRKRRDVVLPAEIRPVSGHSQVGRAVGTPTIPSGFGDARLGGTYDALLNEFMPPSLLVNENREVIQAFRGAGRFLHMRDGRISTDLLELVDPELRSALAGAFPRVFRETAIVTYKGVRIKIQDVDKLVNVTVRPIRSRRGEVFHVLVQFEELEPPPEPASIRIEEIDLNRATREQILTLETELRYTKENLQAIIEELETSNEELQSANQELIASNEELQSTNEELHSVNEELFTVNGEYQRKIAELTELTMDMDNLLLSTEVHTIFLGRDLCIRKFTPKIAETFNLLPQDVGRRIDHFTYTLDYPALLNDLQEVLENGKKIERQIRDRRGNWFLLRVLPYQAGPAIDGAVLTLVDLTRVKQAEAEVRRKDELLGGIFRNSPNWLLIKDLQGRYELVDESFKQAVSCDPIGKTPYDLFPKEVADVLTAGDDRVIAQGVEDQVEVTIPRPDGLHTYLAVKFPIRDETGKITAVGSIKTDISRVKAAEQEAREAVLQRDRFLAMLSHELRNPLAAILNAARIIERSVPDTVSDWLGVIERRSRHMARLLDDLLDVARLSQNKIEMRMAIFDLRLLVADVLEEIRPWFLDRELELISDIAPEPLPVQGDATRLQQVHVNLLMNAAKYTPARGKVWLSILAEGREVCLRVRDNGVGMSSDILHRVFDLFVQADETLDRAAGGIGVGLSLVKAIVELHGGTVEARSPGLGLGSEFIVRLPRAERLPIPNPPIVPPPPKSLRLLIVEDDPDIRDSLRGLLELDGHDVAAAGDAEKAWELLHTQPIEGMLIDIGIPGRSGYELAQRIRKEFRGKQPYLIALTGYGRATDRSAAFAAGFDAHLTKPFQPMELQRELSAIGTRTSVAPS